MKLDLSEQISNYVDHANKILKNNFFSYFMKLFLPPSFYMQTLLNSYTLFENPTA